MRTPSPLAAAQAGGGALLDDVATEAEECSWPSLRRGLPACRFDEGAVLDEAAEILLVKMATGNRFDSALENRQRKLGGHQFEDNGAVFEFGAKPPHCGGEDAAMVVTHRIAEGRGWMQRAGIVATIARGFKEEPSFIEKLIALQNFLLVPRT